MILGRPNSEIQSQEFKIGLIRLGMISIIKEIRAQTRLMIGLNTKVSQYPKENADAEHGWPVSIRMKHQ